MPFEGSFRRFSDAECPRGLSIAEVSFSDISLKLMFALFDVCKAGCTFQAAATKIIAQNANLCFLGTKYADA